MSKHSTGRFLLAGLLGAVAGAVGGLLLAPQSGKKTREKISKLAGEVARALRSEVDDTKARVKDIFGKVSDEAMSKYKTVRNSVAGKVAAVKTAGEDVDKDKYVKLVEDVVDDYKEDFKSTKDGVGKMVSYLKKDWEKVKKALQ